MNKMMELKDEVTKVDSSIDDEVAVGAILAGLNRNCNSLVTALEA